MTARSYRVFDLGRPLEVGTPVAPGHPNFRMALVRRHGDVLREDGSSSANELISTSGHTGTHIDALAHFSKAGRLHGGGDAVEASQGGRFKVLGADSIAPIVTRGVLLDVAGAEGSPALEPGRPITAADVVKTCGHHGLEIGRGDAVLFRTGWPVDRYLDEPAYVGWPTGVPGPDLSAALWLAERGIHVTGSDTIAYEWLAPGSGHGRLPVHVALLVDNGIHIIEVLDLEELAAAGVREFLFVCSPLKLVGATGSPVRPLALVEA
ncbi:MAG: cyclase family protein [Candidatus Dormibacteraeota bacterium]|nr:cyclase family protein [Candidatus Dormibacteraeota bacterium]